MCNLTDQKSEILSGYKFVAVDNEGNYRSLFTWQKYGIGPVPKPPQEVDQRIPKMLFRGLRFEVFYTYWEFFKESYVGYTSSFVNLEDAKEFTQIIDDAGLIAGYDVKIVKITYAEAVVGNFDGPSTYNIIAGKEIVSIESLSE